MSRVIQFRRCHGRCVDARVSPDGRWIAFALCNYPSIPRIAYSDAHRGGEVTVISEGHSPAW